MRIYIDEAGNFVHQASGQSLFSLVLALVLPSSIEIKLFDEFSNLLSSWPHIVAHLTPEHHPPIVAQLQELAAAIRRMPNQLFLQAFLTIDLVLKVLQESTLYYVQRLREELGSIAWIIDQKNRTITEMENTWSTLVLPMSESHFAKKPLLSLVGADYSHFDASYRIKAHDAETNRHLQWMRDVYGILEGERPPGLNATLLLSERREFADSAGSLGLQLADMLATILRRAFNNRLQPPGWAHFGCLLIAERPTPIFQLGPPGGHGGVLRGKQIEKVWHALKSGNKKMVMRPLPATNNTPVRRRKV